jgi:hypothetical protein
MYSVCACVVLITAFKVKFQSNKLTEFYLKCRNTLTIGGDKFPVDCELLFGLLSLSSQICLSLLSLSSRVCLSSQSMSLVVLTFIPLASSSSSSLILVPPPHHHPHSSCSSLLLLSVIINLTHPIPLSPLPFSAPGCQYSHSSCSSLHSSWSSLILPSFLLFLSPPLFCSLQCSRVCLPPERMGWESVR